MKNNFFVALEFAICTTSLALYAWPVAAQPHYSITDLGTLGGKSSTALAINDMGQVVGSSETAEKYDDGLEITHAFLWQDGKMTDLGTLPNAPESTAYDINNKGQVLVCTATKLSTMGGWNTILPKQLGSFIWQNGNKTLLPFDEPPATDHRGRPGVISVEQSFRHINDQGEVVDYRYILNNKGQKLISGFIGGERLPDGSFKSYRQGVFYDGDKEVVLGTLGGERSSAWGMNDKGQVVGDSATAKKQQRAFLWQDGKMTKLKILPGFISSQAYAINNEGQIIGHLQNGTEQRLAVWLAGKVYDLNTLIPPDSGCILRDVSDINDEGQIVGRGSVNGESHAFLLTPITASNLKK